MTACCTSACTQGMANPMEATTGSFTGGREGVGAGVCVGERGSSHETIHDFHLCLPHVSAASEPSAL